MRLKLISCEVFFREMAVAIPRSVNEVDVDFLPSAAPHPECPNTCERLQSILDKVDESKFHAVLFAHGLCHQGVIGLQSRSVPLVLPRTEDCSALLQDAQGRCPCFAPPPGATSSKKCAHHKSCSRTIGPHACRGRQRFGGMIPDELELGAATAGPSSRAEFDPALGSDFPMPALMRSAYAEPPLGHPDYLEFQAHKEAEWFGWDFEQAAGDLPRFQRFLDGYWSHHEFLVVPPGFRVAMATSEEIITAEECPA